MLKKPSPLKHEETIDEVLHETLTKKEHDEKHSLKSETPSASGDTEGLTVNANDYPKVEKGKVMIWPADWTFTYRDLPTPEEKFIATGWWNFEFT